MVLGVLVAGLIICSRLIKPRGKIKVGWVRGAKSAATGALVYIAIIIVSIAVELGGLINVGLWRLARAARCVARLRRNPADAHGPATHPGPCAAKPDARDPRRSPLMMGQPCSRRRSR